MINLNIYISLCFSILFHIRFLIRFLIIIKKEESFTQLKTIYEKNETIRGCELILDEQSFIF